MKIDTAIEILAEMHDAADGPRADALGLAIATLEDARDRHATEVERRLELADEGGAR